MGRKSLSCFGGSNAPDLHVHSGFSTFDGMGSPEAIVDRAVKLGWSGVCLSEHGWMGSAPALYQFARKAGIKPIIGCEMYVTSEDNMLDGDKTVLKDKRHLTVLALSKEGYQNMVTWTNIATKRPAFYDGPRISIDRMVESAPWPLHHNVVLSGCMGSELCQSFLQFEGSRLDIAALTYVELMRAAFPNFYLEIHDHQHEKFMGVGLENYETMCATQSLMRDGLLWLAAHTGVPVIVSNDAHFQSQEQRTAHIAMMARKDHQGKGQDNALSYTQRYTYWRNYMQPMEPLAERLPAWAAKEAVESIHAIVAESSLILEPLDKATHTYTMPKSGVADPIAEIRLRSESRLNGMVNVHGQEAIDRFEFELDALGEFAHYLVIYSNVVRLARALGVWSWTRGSAANSLVVFCLGIHNIDPIHYGLMFERFVNPARKKLPDVDIDFEGVRRDDVARAVEEMMAEIEGPNNMIGVCNYGTVANRAAFRLVAASLGIEQERIDELAKLLPQMIDSGMVSDEEAAYELLKDEAPDLHMIAEQLFDAPSHVSQHACAYALGTRDRPLSEWVPNYLIASSNTNVTSYNMKWIEELGFMKLDLLRLDTLTICHRIARMLGKDMQWLDDIMRDGPGTYGASDPKVYKLLGQGRTEGIHSMQGGTQRRGCIEVQPQNEFDLIAIQALYRPSGTRMVEGQGQTFTQQFVNRRRGQEDWRPSENEIVAEVLAETYGVPVYQEQPMQIGAKMGMTGLEIDDLYQAIKTAKGVGRGAKELFAKFKPTFVRYAKKFAGPAAIDHDWRDFDAFQGYGFNKGHAACYAILALKMAWLKVHYPREFFTALLEYYPNNPRYIAAAIAEGFTFDAPDVNVGTGGFSAGSGKRGIRIGLLKIEGIGAGAASEIVRNQPYSSIEDLQERCDGRRVNKTTVANLAAVGALSCIGIEGERNDLTDLELMRFVPRRPEKFDGVEPVVRKVGGRKWRFLGLQKGVDISEGKTFCAKLFWLPKPARTYDEEGNVTAQSNFVTKTSASGQYNAHLLTVVDENGIPFDIIVGEKKKTEAKLLKVLAMECDDAVICAEGQITMPFMRGMNTGFRLWGIAEANNSNPQVWGLQENVVRAIVRLAQEKDAERRG